MQGIQQFEKYRILLAEAEANGDTARVGTLKELLKSVDISRIATESEAIVNGFRDALNKM